jgi:hypothetical protein
MKVVTRGGGVANNGSAIRHYDKCMDAALSSLIECQKGGGLITFLCLGNDIRNLQLKVPVAFVLGDAKSQDHLAGRFGAHNTRRMCRACDVSYEESGNVDYTCNLILHDQFVDTVRVAINEDNVFGKREVRAAFVHLQASSQHAVINAFQHVDFGGHPRGIFGCTPHDLMHAFLEGVLKYCTRIFVNQFQPRQKAAIDLFVDELFGTFRSSEKPNMPRTNFCKGMTNLTMITADEEVGMALTLLILA